jgi:hypothetical protein
MDTGVADGARTHDNRNHNPYFYIFLFVDWYSIININQQLITVLLDKKTALVLIVIWENSENQSVNSL